MKDLKTRIEEGLEIARENGYTELFDMSLEEIADDMLSYYAEVEGEDPALMVPIIDTWIKKYKEQ